MTKLHRSFKVRLVSLCILILVIIIAVIHVTVYTITKSMIERELIRNAQGIAVAVTYNVMENIEDYKAFIITKDVNSPYYKKMQALFAKIKEHSNAKFIYSERRLDEKTSEFILDSEPIESEGHSPPGSIDPHNAEKEAVYLSKYPSGYKLGTYSVWGSLLGAFAPIFDTNGEVLGIIGVDIDGSFLYNYLRTLQLVLCFAYLIILSIILFLLMKYSSAILEPLLKDKLTTAYNKRYLERFLQTNIDIAHKEERDLTLLMLDLDRFKNINDTYGHTFGDKVLSSISTIIKHSLRQNDNFFRYGGEEFIIVIPDVKEKQSMEIAERIRNTIEKSEIHNIEKDIPVKITVSIGVATLDSTVLTTADFINNADKALYAAKEFRNAVSLYKKACNQS